MNNHFRELSIWKTFYLVLHDHFCYVINWIYAQLCDLLSQKVSFLLFFIPMELKYIYYFLFMCFCIYLSQTDFKVRIALCFEDNRLNRFWMNICALELSVVNHITLTNTFEVYFVQGHCKQQLS